MKTVAEMSELEEDATRAWLNNWQTLGPILEGLRHEEIRNVKNVTSLAVFNSFFRTAIRNNPSGPHIGTHLNSRNFF